MEGIVALKCMKDLEWNGCFVLKNKTKQKAFCVKAVFLALISVTQNFCLPHSNKTEDKRASFRRCTFA